MPSRFAPKVFYLLRYEAPKDVNFGEPVSSVDFHEGSRLIAKKSQDFKLVEVANEEHTTSVRTSKEKKQGFQHQSFKNANVRRA